MLYFYLRCSVCLHFLSRCIFVYWTMSSGSSSFLYIVHLPESVVLLMASLCEHCFILISFFLTLELLRLFVLAGTISTLLVFDLNGIGTMQLLLIDRFGFSIGGRVSGVGSFGVWQAELEIVRLTCSVLSGNVMLVL